MKGDLSTCGIFELKTYHFKKNKHKYLVFSSSLYLRLKKHGG